MNPQRMNKETKISNKWLLTRIDKFKQRIRFLNYYQKPQVTF